MPREFSYDAKSDEARDAARTARALITARLSTLEGDTAEDLEFSSRQLALVLDEIEASDDPERAWRLLILVLIRAGVSAVWQLAGCLDIEPDEAMSQLAALWEKHDVTL